MSLFRQKPKVKVTRKVYQYLVVINAGGTYFEQTFENAPVVIAKADEGHIAVYDHGDHIHHWLDDPSFMVFKASYSPSTGDNFRVKKQILMEVEEWV